MGYPGIVLDKSGEEIKGFIFSAESLAEHWQRLDEFEGNGYSRVLTKVRLKNDQYVNAFIYTLKA